MRKLHWSILKRLYRLLTPRYRVVRRQGAMFLLDNRNWIDTRLLIGQPYERGQVDSSVALVKDLGITRIIDVGANMGVYTVLLTLRTAVETTLAFEPVRRNYDQLCANIFLNGLNGRVVAVNAALSDRTADAEILVDPTSTGVSRLALAGSRRDPGVFSARETIRCVRLDDEHRIAGARVFIKVDVEGHELEAIKGMTETLRNNMVVLQVEALTDERAQALDAMMTAFGYRLLSNPGGDRRYTNVG